jgi:hypothetical protein
LVKEALMTDSRRHSHRFKRMLIPLAVCAALALSLTGVAYASGGTNYGNFNPLTGQPYSLSDSTDPAAPAEPAAPTVQPVVEDNSDQALAIGLAAAALLVALAGAGYTVIRISRLPRPAGSR